mgnify:CR=1 FL=1
MLAGWEFNRLSPATGEIAIDRKMRSSPASAKRAHFSAIDGFRAVLHFEAGKRHCSP